MTFVQAAAHAAAHVATAALEAQIGAVVAQLEGLPQALAREVPAAVRDHDEAEALRLSNEALDSSLQKQIAAAATCSEIGKLTGFTFNATENTITCEDCFRYAPSNKAPGILRRGARDAGVFKGVDLERHPPKGRERQGREKRPMKTVRWEVKHHCRAGSLHEWCVVHADEQRKITTRAISQVCMYMHMHMPPVPPRVALSSSPAYAHAARATTCGTLVIPTPLWTTCT